MIALSWFLMAVLAVEIAVLLILVIFRPIHWSPLCWRSTIDARIAWWDERNPESLRGRGPDYWRSPYRHADWKGVDLKSTQ